MNYEISKPKLIQVNIFWDETTLRDFGNSLREYEYYK